MSYDEPLVGSLSIIFAITAAAIAIGPWDAPYDLRTVAAFRDRFGMMAARGVWVALAIGFLSAGTLILNGIRPSYAVPASQSELHR